MKKTLLSLLFLLLPLSSQAAVLIWLVDEFGLNGLSACITASDFLPHTRQDCEDTFNAISTTAHIVDEAVEAGVEQAIETTEQCLGDFQTCVEQGGEEVVNTLVNAGDEAFVSLSGRIHDRNNTPIAGAVITALPIHNDVFIRNAFRHTAISDLQGRWQIHINRLIAYNGTYRVTAVGPLHDFLPLEYEVEVQ